MSEPAVRKQEADLSPECDKQVRNPALPHPKPDTDAVSTTPPSPGNPRSRKRRHSLA